MMLLRLREGGLRCRFKISVAILGGSFSSTLPRRSRIDARSVLRLRRPTHEPRVVELRPAAEPGRTMLRRSGVRCLLFGACAGLGSAEVVGSVTLFSDVSAILSAKAWVT
jgi:hypothetical protein